MQHLLKSTFTFILLCLVFSVSAQAPPKFNYQGIARDANGNPIANQRMSIQLEILPSLEATQAEYQETQIITTNEFGLYTLQIGNGIPTVGDMKLVKWETGNQYIHVRIDPSGGNQFVEAGTTQLLSVPYALYADKAGVARESLNGSTQKNTRATNNYIEKTSGAGVANSTSLLYDNGTSIGLGTTTPSARFQISQNIASVQEHLRMQNSSATGAGRFTLYNDGASSYATFTKYGSTYAGGYAGITTLYPYANLLAFGNNGLASGDGLGRFLISSAGNIGISIAKPGTSKLKLHLDYTSENVGIGGNSVPVSRVHLNNTDGTTMDVNLTNNTTGHTATDGLQIKNVGTAASITNKENDVLTLGTNNTTRLTLTAAGNTELTGQIKIAGGAPGSGKVLTSDATGLATWQTPSGGGGLPAGTANQTLRHDGSNWVANSALTNNGTQVGIGIAPSSAAPLAFANILGQKINFLPIQDSGYCVGVEASDLRFAGGTGVVDAITFRTQGYTGNERMRIAGNGNVGIGTNAPSAKLDVAGTIKISGGAPGTGKVLTSDANGLASWQTPAAGGSSFFQVSPTNSNHIIYTNAANYGKNFLVNADSVNYDGAGIDGKMMFIGSKSAYRAGAVNTTAWNLDSIGLYSIGLGANTIAKGDHSVALGTNTIASGSFSTAIGNSTTASGLFSTAMGANTIAAGYGSFALGGFTIASGTYSTSIGQWSKANSVFETAIGNYNDTLVVANSTSWAGDSNRVFTVGNGTAANNRSTAFVVQQNGNVGVGVRVAQTKLDINGQIKISGGAPGLGKVLTSDANGLATWQTPSGGGSLPAGSLDQTLRHNGTTWVANSALTNNGTEVGIGIAASNAAPLSFANAVGKKINFYPAQPDGYCMGVEASDLRFAGGTAGSDAITFRTQGYNGTERMRIAGNGNVGIGVTNPNYPLSFNGGNVNDGIVIDLLSSSAASHKIGVYNGDLRIGGGDNANSAIEFSVGNNGANPGYYSAPNIVIYKDSSFFYRKSIFGNNSYSNDALVSNNNRVGSGYNATFYNHADPINNVAHGIGISAGSSSYNPSFQSNLIFFQTPTGGVLGGVLQAGSNSVSYLTSSDSRLKQNIVPSKSGLKDLMKIEIKDYSYKADKNNLPQNGFIAQQLYSVYPDAVKKGGEDEKTNPWMVDYGRVTPLIIQSVQDQQHIIDDLKSKLEAQQQLIEQLAKKVDELSSK